MDLCVNYLSEIHYSFMVILILLTHFLIEETPSLQMLSTIDGNILAYQEKFSSSSHVTND